MATRKTAVTSDSDEVVEEAQFEVSAALFEELGERLVSKPEVALAELVKNAYDADAQHCWVTVTPASITVRDDGHGMTRQVFLARWMVISDRDKERRRFSPKYRRAMAGSKGIGRFSARYLGQVVKLTTTAFDRDADCFTELSATFDWNRIDSTGDIAKVKIEYRYRKLSGAASAGTVIEISQVREEAKRTNAAKVRTEILRLTDPFAGLDRPTFFHETGKRSAAKTASAQDPGFSLIYSDAEGKADVSAMEQNVQAKILNRFLGRVRVELDDNGQLNYQVFWNAQLTPVENRTVDLRRLCKPYTREALTAELNRLRKEADVTQLPSPPIHTPVAEQLGSPLLIDLRFFPKRTGTFAGLGVDGRTAQSWFSERASIAIIDNGFPMAAYSNDTDWLEINKSKSVNERNWQSLLTTTLYPMSPEEKADPGLNPMIALPRGTQLLGRIYIATSKQSSEGDEKIQALQPNMDRESLRDNDAFRLLWQLARFAVELIGHFDRKIRREQEIKDEEDARETAKVSLTKAIAEVRTSKQIAPEFKQKIVAQLKDTQARFKEVERYERESRISLELMSLMGVFAGFMTHEFEKALHTLGRATALIKRASARDEGLKGLYQELSKMEASLAGFMDYSRLFIETARNPRAQAFKVKGQLEIIRDTLKNVNDAHAIDVEIDVAAQVNGPHVPLAAYNGIATNLISNAMKALLPKISKEKRRIRVHAFNEHQSHCLIVSDNGIGIPGHLRDRIWDPLYTTTTTTDENPLSTGLGLGLTLTQRVVKNLSGRIELLEQAPPGFVTAFKVTLPL